MNREILQVYFICGTADCPKGNLLEVLEQALQGGITCFQFREKGEHALKGQAKLDLVRRIQRLCEFYQVPLIIDDDVMLALEIGADGIHLGQKDLSIKEARQLFPKKIIGLSVGTLEEYQMSDIDLVDYIGSGPVFPTISKDDARSAIGFDGLKKLRQANATLPIVAIGGLTAKDIPDIKATGVDGLAVISAIARADNVKRTVKDFVAGYKND